MAPYKVALCGCEAAWCVYVCIVTGENGKYLNNLGVAASSQRTIAPPGVFPPCHAVSRGVT